MEQRAEDLTLTAEEHERKEDDASAQQSRQEAARWMQKANAAKSQLDDVSKVLDQKRGTLDQCQREAPSLLRREEQEGRQSTICEMPEKKATCTLIGKHWNSLSMYITVRFFVLVHLCSSTPGSHALETRAESAMPKPDRDNSVLVSHWFS